MCELHKEKQNSFSFYVKGLLISGVFSVGGRLSLIVIRNTVIDRRAEIPSVTFSPESQGTKNTSKAVAKKNNNKLN